MTDQNAKQLQKPCHHVSTSAARQLGEVGARLARCGVAHDAVMEGSPAVHRDANMVAPQVSAGGFRSRVHAHPFWCPCMPKLPAALRRRGREGTALLIGDTEPRSCNGPCPRNQPPRRAPTILTTSATALGRNPTAGKCTASPRRDSCATVLKSSIFEGRAELLSPRPSPARQPAPALACPHPAALRSPRARTC
jgi:hypothetical protein